MSEINYDDKADLIVDTTIDNIFKVTASDMNEIKNVVNGNAEEVGDITSLTTTDKTNVVNAINELNVPEKWVSVGTTAPSDGRRVWFAKSKNLLPTNKYIATTTINGITFTNNGDGTFNISGTATANKTIGIIPENNFQLEQGQAYYLYSSVPYNANTFNLSIAMTDKGSLKFMTANSTYTPTAQPTQERLSIYIPNGTTINATNVKLMLVKGNTAPSVYEPYVEPSIKVDGNEIYNLKLQTPQKITLSFNTTYVYETDLDYTCFRLGKLVFLFINTLAFRVGTTDDFPNYSNIVSGLPRPAQTKIFYLQPSGNFNRFRTNVTTTGNMQRHWSLDPSYGNSANKQYSGFIVYETID